VHQIQPSAQVYHEIINRCLRDGALDTAFDLVHKLADLEHKQRPQSLTTPASSLLSNTRLQHLLWVVDQSNTTDLPCFCAIVVSMQFL